jgi:diguanylate cyclase
VNLVARLFGWFRDAADMAFGGKGAGIGEDIRNDILMTEYHQLGQQIPFLYLTVAMTSIAAAVASQGDFPLAYRFFAPALVVIVCSARLIVWSRRQGRMVTLAVAQQNLRGTSLTSIGLGGFAGAWSVFAFFETALPHRAFVPIFGLLATFAAVYCLSSFRRAALSALLLGSLPITFALLTSNYYMFEAMGVCVLFVTFLQVRLIADRHRQMMANVEAQHKMRELANTDMLTQLPNRRWFFEQLDHVLQRENGTRSFSVALLDLDGFKQINDRLGHLAGDELLQTVADRLRSCADATTVFGRIGGDEFAILFDVAAPLEHVSAKATGIMASLAAPCTLSGRRVAISASLGMAQFPSDGRTIEELLLVADKALYAAKQSGKSRHREKSGVLGLASIAA